MERKVLLCLDCHAIFYDGVNHWCPKVDKLHFISKLRVGKKHVEDIHGSNSHVQTNSVGQTEGLHYPSTFLSSTVVENQLHAEYLLNISNGTNSYLKSHQEEYRDIPVMNTSKPNIIFDLPLEMSCLVPLRGNDENSLPPDCLVGVQSHTSDTRQETSNYSTVPGVSLQARELQNDSIESSITKCMDQNFMLTPILYEREGLRASSFSGGSSSGEYFATTGVNNRDMLLNTDFFKLESQEGMNERSNLCSTNILAADCIPKNFDIIPVVKKEDENQAPHPHSSPQVIYQTCDIGVNKLAGNDIPLVSERDEYLKAGPSNGNVKDYCELRDGRFMCRLCGTSCSSYYNFVVHYRIHSGERPFPCNKCPKRFTQKCHLISHLRIHSEERPYPCDMCEKIYFSQVDLGNHHQLIHSAERPYACDKCPKRFTAQWNLTLHRRTHSGDRPYPCDMCDKGFTRKYHLDRHRQTHFRH